MKKIEFTMEGFDRIKAELEELQKIKRPAAVERLQKARAMGDLSENSEYVAAKEDLAFVEGRVRELEELVSRAEIVHDQNGKGYVQVGSRVTVQTAEGKEQYHIVGEFEADPLVKKLSHSSPIGNALMGKKIGNEVEVNIPAGKVTYKIVDIV